MIPIEFLFYPWFWEYIYPPFAELYYYFYQSYRFFYPYFVPGYPAPPAQGQFYTPSYPPPTPAGMPPMPGERINALPPMFNPELFVNTLDRAVAAPGKK